MPETSSNVKKSKKSLSVSWQIKYQQIRFPTLQWPLSPRDKAGKSFFFIPNDDANQKLIFVMSLGCIWRHFGVSRAFKYVPGNCDVEIVAFISSGHKWTKHAWKNSM